MQKCTGDLCIYHSVTSLNGSVTDLHQRAGRTNATKIRFEFCNLPKFFQSFSERHRNIVEVIVKKGNISELSADTFLCATKLKILDLSDNNFKSIYRHYFMGAVNLQELNLANNKIENIERGMFDCLPNLKQLNLSFNRIRSLPVEIFSKNLELSRVDLSENVIKEIDPKIFFDNTQLIKISLARNQLSELTLEFTNNNLATLDVSSNSLKKFDIWAQESLAGTKFYLFAQENKLDSLLIVDFNVVVINVSFNMLQNLNFLANVEYKSLKWANVSENQITTVDPKVLNSLKQLNYLGLENNHLESLPVKELRELTNLRELDLQNNRIQRFFAEDVLKSWPKLKSLDLRGNKLRRQNHLAIHNALQGKIKLNLDEHMTASEEEIDENDRYDAISERLREIDEFDGLSIISQSELTLETRYSTDDLPESSSETGTNQSERSSSGVDVVLVCAKPSESLILNEEVPPQKPPRLFAHHSSPSAIDFIEDEYSSLKPLFEKIESPKQVEDLGHQVQDTTNQVETANLVQERFVSDTKELQIDKAEEKQEESEGILSKLQRIRLDQINFILLLIVISTQFFAKFNQS